MIMKYDELPPLGRLIRNRLLHLRKQEGDIWTQNRLAELSYVSSGGMSQIIQGKVEPKASTLKNIARALCVESLDIFRAAGIIESPVSVIDSELLHWARMINRLNPIYKKMGVEMVKTIAIQLAQGEKKSIGDTISFEELSRFFRIQQELQQRYLDIYNATIQEIERK